MGTKSTREEHTVDITTKKQDHPARLNFRNSQQREAHIYAFLRGFQRSFMRCQIFVGNICQAQSWVISSVLSQTVLTLSALPWLLAVQ